jgi:hypothetical protein
MRRDQLLATGHLIKQDRFLFGRHDLLADICKSNHDESADKLEVGSFLCEVSGLKSQLEQMQVDKTRVTIYKARRHHAQELSFTRVKNTRSIKSGPMNPPWTRMYSPGAPVRGLLRLWQDKGETDEE